MDDLAHYVLFLYADDSTRDYIDDVVRKISVRNMKQKLSSATTQTSAVHLVTYFFATVCEFVSTGRTGFNSQLELALVNLNIAFARNRGGSLVATSSARCTDDPRRAMEVSGLHVDIDDEHKYSAQSHYATQKEADLLGSLLGDGRGVGELRKKRNLPIAPRSDSPDQEFVKGITSSPPELKDDTHGN